jgi:hypothetical protein
MWMRYVFKSVPPHPFGMAHQGGGLTARPGLLQDAPWRRLRASRTGLRDRLACHRPSGGLGAVPSLGDRKVVCQVHFGLGPHDTKAVSWDGSPDPRETGARGPQLPSGRAAGLANPRWRARRRTCPPGPDIQESGTSAFIARGAPPLRLGFCADESRARALQVLDGPPCFGTRPVSPAY